MKIAVVSDSRVVGERANAIAVNNTAQSFAELGHDVTLIVPARGGNKEATTERIAKLFGFQPKFRLEVLSVCDSHRALKLGTKLWFQLVSWSFAFAVRKHLKRNSYDLVYTRSQYVSFLSDSVYEAHHCSLMKRFMVAGRRVVCISLPIWEEFKRGSVIPLGYRRHPAEKVRKSEVLYVGSRFKEKGIDLIEKSRHEITVVTGLPHKEVYNYLEGAKVLLLPSTGKHNCPLKLVEYMSTEKSIVACDRPNVRSLMGATPFYFEMGNVEDMDRKIDLALENPQGAQNIPLTWDERAKIILSCIENG